ncbi:glycosyltransferase family 2 protein [Cohnella hashimotonis]|uniref:Glycosyltransferase family 2 protein n=1 Tax=Cohnella hashimotonis TaxID=2826895 RepID=A0ABT6TU04_9BACL|nr:glycosyltransferase family 2 protein [Cohnella hashimotonis]MDI4650325.1 glycosyltransferase family 2 protein [Cohnella hashimotonis]
MVISGEGGIPPKVSIVTIVYNNVTGLERTIQSVLQQKKRYSNIEFVIVDGGSTDGTVDLIEQYSSEVSSWISERDNGISDAFNKGILNATGEVLFFLNSGDTFIDDIVLYNVAQEWARNPVDILFYKVHVEGQKFIPANSYKDNENDIWKMSDVPHQGAFVSNTVFNKIGLFNLNYGIRMDLEFFARCRKKNCSHRYIPEVIVSYETGGKSMLKSNRKQFWKEGMSVKYLYSIPFTVKDVIKMVIYR